MRTTTRQTSGRRPVRGPVGGIAVAGLVVAMLATGTAPAEAGSTTDRYPVVDSYEYVNWDCGYPIEVAGALTGNTVERLDSRTGLVYATSVLRLSERWTNADGEWFDLTVNEAFVNLPAKSIGDGRYLAASQEAGQPMVVTDSSGTVVSRDRGGIRFSYILEPAVDGFEFLGARVAAPHPGFFEDLCAIVAPLVGTDSATRLTEHPLGTTDAGMGYVEYLPTDYDPSGDGSPLLVAANGYGENGDGSAEQLGNLYWTGIPRFIAVGGWPADRPFVVLATQHIDAGSSAPCDETTPWPGSCSMQWQHDQGHAPPTACTTPDELHDFISYAIENYHVDPSRVYVTGLSCGGFGVWEYLAEYGDEQVAAAVPIAGEGRPAWSDAGCELDATGIWAFHGEVDDIVNPLGSIEAMTGLQGCAGIAPERAKLTVYPGLGHEGWDQAYSGSEGDDIYGWMLAQSK